MFGLLINPTAGAGRGMQTRQIIIDYLSRNNLGFKDISGNSFESARVNLRAFLGDESPRAVIVVGGDGMVHLAIQELAESDVAMLLIPSGTGNDFARSLSLELDSPLEIIERAVQKPPTRIDLAQVNGRYFAEILSTGFDSKVNERANRMKIRSKIKYDLAMALELPIFKPINYSIRIDGTSFSTKAMLIAVANGKSYGGGMKVSPNSDLQDGLLELFILKPVSKFEFLRVFPKVFKGSHIDHPQVQVISGKSIEISAEAVAYADGERIGPLPIKVEIKPRALLTWTGQ
jgi:diacylglycerol kinase (ATP)